MLKFSHLKSVVTLLALSLLTLPIAKTANADNAISHMRPNVTTLSVKKMMCADCAAKVKAALLNVSGVETVEVNSKANRVVVTTRGNSTSPEQLISAVKGAGFSASVEH